MSHTSKILADSFFAIARQMHMVVINHSGLVTPEFAVGDASENCPPRFTHVSKFQESDGWQYIYNAEKCNAYASCDADWQ